MFNSFLLVRFSAFLLVFSLVSCGGASGGGADTPAASTSSSSAVLSSAVSSQSSMSSLMSSVASSAASSSALSAPQNVTAIAANGSVTLSWSLVAGATGYNIYYAAEPNVLIANIASFDEGTRVLNVSSPRVLSGLRNEVPYYFVVTALRAGVEGAPSREVSATPTAVDLARQPTAQEVLVVELINRARANPEAEAMRLGIGLNDGITGTPITATAKQPLAHNLFLLDSARAHSQWMLDADVFSHTGSNNSTATERMSAAGYVFAGSWSSGENIAWGGTRAASINLTAYAFSQHEGLFKSPGHRVNILNGNFREIGVGQKQGNFFTDGVNYLSSMLTQNFARSGAGYYLTGVVYNDINNNNFYDVGEGLSGITIAINGVSYPVYTSGAYSIPLGNGTYSLSITGADLGTPVFHSVNIANANRKVDVVKRNNLVEVVAP